MNENRVSRTSQLIAASLVYAATRPELARHVPVEDAALYRERLPLCSAYARRLMMLSRPVVRRFSSVVEGFLLPGIVAHYVIRKMILRQIAEQAMRADGMQQVVILGSGLDLLGRRLALDFSSSTVFETDRVDSIAMKETLLGSDRPGNLMLLGHDLSSVSIEDALASARGFRKDRPTVVIAEGVLMYRPLGEVRQLFVSLQRLITRPLRIVFTYMESEPSGRVRFRNQNRLVTWWLTRSGEPFLWDMPLEALATFLSQAGYALEQSVSTVGYAAENQLLPPETPPPARGELIASARSCNDEQ